MIICQAARLVAFAGTCLAAALPARSLAQCATCPPGAIIENEPQCTTPDVVNGGCNHTPVLYGNIVPGQTVCGKTWSTGQLRDTDWYYLYLSTQTSLTVTGKADFLSEIAFSQAFVQGTCSAPSYANVITAACGSISWNVTLPAGGWWFTMAPEFGPVVPCGTPYTLTLSLRADTASCCLPNGTCQNLTSAACTSAGGVFRQGVLCGNCPQIAGAWNEQIDAGHLVNTAQVTMGSGPLNSISGAIEEGVGEADMYAIRICNPAGFSASTSGPGTLNDTQLFLFRINGTGIAFNDDNPAGGTVRSRLSSAFTSTLPVGVYYLAISAYDEDPGDDTYAEIWLDQPYTTERAPDGPAAANSVTTWDGGIPGGTYTISLTGACYASPPGWTEVNDAAEIFTGSQSIAGNGVLEAISGRIAVDADADLFEFRLCQPQIFSAETVTGPGTLVDTQLFLFQSTGVGIAFNDDDPQLTGGVRSRLSSAFTSSLPIGQYYLGISGYDRDPVTFSGQQLWLDTPYATERAPDGPGAASPFTVWATGSSGQGTYVVRLTGACYRPVPCYANCDGSTGSPVLTANDFQCFLNKYAANHTYANCDGSTGSPLLTANDFQCFLNKFAAGCS